MKLIKRLLRKIKKLFSRPAGKTEIDPLAKLEAKGLKIAPSSKIRMLSPEGIDHMFPWLIEIGEGCMFSTDVLILAHDASPALPTGYTKMGRVIIGNHVFVGRGATILCGVTIGDDVIIGAETVISRDIPSNSVYAGNPARYICSFAEFREKRRKEIEKACLDYDWKYWSGKASEEEKKAVIEKLKETRVCYIKSDMNPADYGLDEDYFRGQA